MRVSNNFNFFKTLFVIILITCAFTSAQQSNNNAYVFDGNNSQLYIEDGTAVNPGADQLAFQYFNQVGSTTDNNFTVQAWVYLIGENLGKKMPIIHRAVAGDNHSFSLYIDADRKAYFSVDNGNAWVSTLEIPAFTWVQLTGIYDDDNDELKIYFGNEVAEIKTGITLNNPYADGVGLYVGKYGEDAFKGLIDEIRLWNIALGDNNINGSGGNGNPAEPFPNSLSQYSVGQWSFNEITIYPPPPSSGINILEDYSAYLNHLRVNNIDELVDSKHLPFFVVNSIGDDGDASLGDGSAVSLNGDVTLRSAIEETNALPGPRVIYFYIPGNTFTIQPTFAYDPINKIVTLDATTQSGYNGSPIIVLDGSGMLANGLTFSGGNSFLEGLAINNFLNYGLTLTNAGGNTVINNTIGGVLVNTSNNVIINNTLENSPIYGISIENGSDNTILSNTIANNNLGGVSILNGSGSITDNNINENTGDGITVNGGTLISLSENGVNNNTGVGISLSGATGNVTDNILNNNTLGGIYLDNVTGNITGNTITGSTGGDGISITTANNNTVDGNTISLNVNGITVNGGTLASLSGNGVNNNTGIGISLSGTTGNIISNNLNDNTSGGIYLSNVTGDVTTNTISGSSNGDGISITGTNNNIVEGNNVTSNKRGISLNTSDFNTLSGNEVSGNSGHGIVINGNIR